MAHVYPSYRPRPRARYQRAPWPRGLGDTTPAPDPVSGLISQINRFTGPDAPDGYRVADAPWGVASGNLALVAPVAVVLYQRAATDSYNQFHDAGSATQITKANAGFTDPSGWVTKNMAEVTTLITSLADSLSLPMGAATSGTTSTVLIIGVLAAAVWLLSR